MFIFKDLKYKIALLILFIIVGLVYVIYSMNNKINSLNKSLSHAINNNRTLIASNSSLEDKYRTLKFTIDELNSYNDSITLALKDAVKENKIKDKNISQLQYMLSHNFRIDTIKTVDTIFTKSVDIDTLITDDKWYQLQLQLKYPNIVTVAPQFNNEYKTIFYYSRETINPRKKFFLWRLFQKKHYITNTTIINSNPYCYLDTLRVIEIVK